MYNKIQELFDNDSTDTYNNRLSATVTKLWGNMIDEVVVWGITKLMGESFKLHSQALSGYETAMYAESQNAAPSLAHQRIATVAASVSYTHLTLPTKRIV